jgi:hypothetical protein
MPHSPPLLPLRGFPDDSDILIPANPDRHPTPFSPPVTPDPVFESWIQKLKRIFKSIISIELHLFHKFLLKPESKHPLTELQARMPAH